MKTNVTLSNLAYQQHISGAEAIYLETQTEWEV
jgi:hypothetical protein